MDTESRALVGRLLHEQVIRQARGRCQCKGECGTNHRKSGDGRCHVEHTAYKPLLAMPREPVSFRVAVTLKCRQLYALCNGCYGKVEKGRETSEEMITLC